MVVAFVAFLGGWFKAVLGPDALFLGGALAACIVTFFTFLPSFIFILAGGPIIESTKGRLGFTAPLSAITAAVVGVILNLAVKAQAVAARTIWLPAGTPAAMARPAPACRRRPRCRWRGRGASGTAAAG